MYDTWYMIRLGVSWLTRLASSRWSRGWTARDRRRWCGRRDGTAVCVRFKYRCRRTDAVHKNWVISGDTCQWIIAVTGVNIICMVQERAAYMRITNKTVPICGFKAVVLTSVHTDTWFVIPYITIVTTYCLIRPIYSQITKVALWPSICLVH